MSGLSLHDEKTGRDNKIRLSVLEPTFQERVAHNVERFFMPIFSIARALYISTVLTLMSRRAAISLFAWPHAMRR